MHHRRVSLGHGCPPIATPGQLPTRSYHHCNMGKASDLPSSVDRSSLTLSQDVEATNGFRGRTQQRLLRRSRSLDSDSDDDYVDPQGDGKHRRNSMVLPTKTPFRWTLKSMLSSSSSSSSFRESSSHRRQTPQLYLNQILISRGLLFTVGVRDSRLYMKPPTPFQIASYADYITELVHSRDANSLRLALSCGLSPNPDNGKDESLLHTICRKGECEMLQIFLDYGCTLRVASPGTGRTPLHEACWGGHFNVFQRLVQSDPALCFIADARGCTPLSYIPQIHWKQYTDWIQSHHDSLWPDVTTDAIDAFTTDHGPCAPPPPQPQPLPLPLARMLATGRMLPTEVQRYVYRPKLTRANSKSNVVEDKEKMEEQ